MVSATISTKSELQVVSAAIQSKSKLQAVSATTSATAFVRENGGSTKRVGRVSAQNVDEITIY